jgi:hypothetical protein
VNSASTSIQELLAASINEQGFLLQQRVYEEANRAFGKPGSPWVLSATEVPVEVANGKQTRIDIVLAHSKHAGIHVAIECKRANPKFKAWALFGTEQTIRNTPHDQFYFERFRFDGKVGNGLDHRLICTDADIPVFNYYIESRINPRSNSDSRCSSTETIEEAFNQLTIGQKGLFGKLSDHGGASPVLVIPVVVTTAELYRLDFDVNDVSLSHGTIDVSKITNQTIPFGAVNFRVPGYLSARSAHNSQTAEGIRTELIEFQLRTIFVVQSNSLQNFLLALGNTVLSKDLWER